MTNAQIYLATITEEKNREETQLKRVLVLKFMQCQPK